MIRHTVGAALLLLVAGAAEAQPPPPAAELPPVVVEGVRVPDERTAPESAAREELDRVPGGVDLVGEQEIREGRASNLQDVLDFTPGVWIRPRFGAADESQISIRGSGLRSNFHLRGVTILLDGFPYGNADGFSDFESLELLSVKRVEVYKGANSLRFGANTLGGAINLVTKTGYDAGLVELRTEAGSFGYFKAHAATGQVYGPLDLYGGYGYTTIDGFRDWSDQTRHRLYTTVGYRLLGGTTIRFDVNYVRNEENLPGSLTGEQLRADPTQADPANVAQRAARNYDYVRGALTLRTPLGAGQALEWATQLNYQDMDHPLAFAVIDNVTTAWSTELRWLLDRPLFGLGHRLVAGLQYQGTRQIDVNIQNVGGVRGARTKDQDNVSHNVALYAEDQLDVTPAFTVVLGGRGQYAVREVRDRFFTDAAGDVDANDSDSVDFLWFAPRAGAVWRVTPTAQVFANVSYTQEPPALLELTAPGQLQGDLSQLDAQKAWQFEIGTRGTLARGRVAWDLAVYDIELRDEIQNVNVQPFPGAPFTIPRFRNIDRSRHTGVEAGIDVAILRDVARWLGLGTAGDSVRARAAYTWSRFVFVDDPNFGDNDLPGMPRHFLNTELRYEHASGFWLAPNVEVVPEGYFVNSENTARARAHTLFNVRAGWFHRPTQLGVFFEARNLTDVTYASSVVVDAANLRFFEPGEPRSLYGGVQWRFR